MIENVKKKNMMPVLNYTELNETLTNVEKYGFKGKKDKIQARFFPRWTALSKVINPNNKK